MRDEEYLVDDSTNHVNQPATEKSGPDGRDSHAAPASASTKPERRARVGDFPSRDSHGVWVFCSSLRCWRRASEPASS